MSQMRKKTRACLCAREFQVEVAGSEHYVRAKKLFNRGRHPTYIGPSMTRRYAQNGGLIFFRHGEKDVAVSLVNPRLSVLIALNVDPSHRGHGLGSAIVRFLACNWIRSIENRLDFFSRLGYETVGRPHRGRRFITRLMVRHELFSLSGRLKKLASLMRRHCAD